MEQKDDTFILPEDVAPLPQSVKDSEHAKWAEADLGDVRCAWSEVVDYYQKKGKLDSLP